MWTRERAITLIFPNCIVIFSRSEIRFFMNSKLTDKRFHSSMMNLHLISRNLLLEQKNDINKKKSVIMEEDALEVEKIKTNPEMQN